MQERSRQGFPAVPRRPGENCELAADMSARQWVAHAGLDPRAFDSGTSIHKPARISRHGTYSLRAALYMPALIASRYDPHVHAFYEKLLGNGKLKMQAIVAVMERKTGPPSTTG